MESSQSKELMLGALAAIGAYVLWGVLPIYWKLIDGVTAEEVLAQRIIWSFIFMFIIVLITRNMPLLVCDIKQLVATPKKLFSIIAASFVITINWYIFIWAVGHGHVVQSSLGYYINPLISVLMGVIFLKERLSMWQIVSFIIALIGVLLMTIETGTFPWISLGLALSFGLYGLLKKTIHLRAMTGLTIETFIVAPIALIYLVFFNSHAGHSMMFVKPSLTLLLMGAGIVTAIPLLLFAVGANRISLTMVGFFQYIAPTLMLILGTLLYHEPFNRDNLVTFILIWASLILYAVSRTKWLVIIEDKILHKKQHSYTSKKCRSQ
ncbi:EamA family transporter RarD [Scopulibacillus cellulosilyticus]|uniref:EamA family transporter RarD n=1 Tax=Scopulibacillus cellulosilyticus TaxID=2665665 RepID=A0ABW2PPZ8_9BACL